MGIHLSGDSVLTVAGHERYNEQVAPAFIHQVDLSTTVVSHKTDIAISDLRFIGSDNHAGNCTFVPVREFYFNEVAIRLTNHGNHKIENVSIIPDKPYCYNWCYIDDVIYFKELESISLAPGESKDFYIGNVRVQKDMPFSDTFVCLTVIFPDNHIDVDHSNNRFCFDFLSGANNVTTPDEFYFFPNPVTDRIYFKSPTATMLEVSIYDISGNLIKHQKDDFQYLDVADLIPGMYVLRGIGGSEAVMVGKFIKR